VTIVTYYYNLFPFLSTGIIMKLGERRWPVPHESFLFDFRRFVAAFN